VPDRSGIAERVGRALGAAPAAVHPARGGDVNRAMHLDLADGRAVFVKHRPDPAPGMYRAEADGLEWLAAAGAVRVPRVLAVDEGFLALERITPARPAPGHDERLGRGLAALHAAGAPAFGLDRDTWIATVPMPNGPLPDWPAFYGARRIAPLARAARDGGLIGPQTAARLDRVVARLADLCGPPEPPARLHGDLWGGNAMCDERGAPVLVDPAAYGGHREADLAMMRLFGGFGARVFAAYAEAAPLAPGHEDRVELHQLFPLLVHVLLFGGGYAGQVDRVARRYAGR
jgi:fructosamine-3-kinase